MELFPGVPPTVKHIRDIKANVTKTKGPLIVLTAIFYPKHIGETFANDTNAKFRHLSTDVGAPGIDTYPELFDYLTEAITQ